VSVRRAAVLALGIAGFWLVLPSAGCGGPPAAPGPIPPAPPIPNPPSAPPPNTPPAIRSISLSNLRLEAGETVDVKAVVEDAESGHDRLRFEWAADGGAITGEGVEVRWEAPRGGATPANYTISLTVVEAYQALDDDGTIVTREHRVTATASARVHDSPKELGELALRFLSDFANSSAAPDVCVREFSDSCPGKDAELEDIERNRRDYLVIDSKLGPASVSVAGNRTSANITVACEFTSRILNCRDDQMGCLVGGIEEARGNCNMTAVYEADRWWLCTSTFQPLVPLSPSMRLFFGGR
jgi:hypothetical protein